jgi:hypothetical protein
LGLHELLRARSAGLAAVNVDDQPVWIWQQKSRIITDVTDIKDDSGNVIRKLRHADSFQEAVVGDGDRSADQLGR